MGSATPPVVDLGMGRGPSWLDQWLAAHLDQVVSWRRQIHRHPELLREEFRTTGMIVELLTSVGLKPRVLPINTGVICEVGNGARCVALRADIDALPVPEETGVPFASATPGVSHACGHDMHTAILLGTALALASAPQRPGTVRLLFQPAEEEPGGAHDVIEAGGLDGAERIFGLHCDPKLQVGRVGTRVGPITSATDLLHIRVTPLAGRTGPGELGADIVHALGLVITGLPSLLARHVDPRSGTVLTWGMVDTAGPESRTPGVGVLRGTLRTGDPDLPPQLEPQVRKIVTSLLATTHVQFELNHHHAVPVVVNDRASTQILRAAVRAALGEDALTETEQSSGGEDFGWYLRKIPGSLARFGVWPGHGAMGELHQPTFDPDERALSIGIRVMVHAALAALSADEPGSM